MPICAVAACQNGTYNSLFSFYSFPKDPGRRKTWVQKCRREDAFDPNKAKICAEHFGDSDFEDDIEARIMGYVRTRKLKPDAIPSHKLRNTPTPKKKKEAASLKKERMSRLNARRSLNELLESDLQEQFLVSLMTRGSVCGVAACKNTTQKAKDQGKTIRFFHSPSDLELRKQWLILCNRQDTRVPPVSFKVCSEHFTNDDYEDFIKAKILNYMPKCLKKTAVPSLNLEPRNAERKARTDHQKAAKNKKKSVKRLGAKDHYGNDVPSPSGSSSSVDCWNQEAAFALGSSDVSNSQEEIEPIEIPESPQNTHGNLSMTLLSKLIQMEDDDDFKFCQFLYQEMKLLPSDIKNDVQKYMQRAIFQAIERAEEIIYVD